MPVKKMSTQKCSLVRCREVATQRINNRPFCMPHAHEIRTRVNRSAFSQVRPAPNNSGDLVDDMIFMSAVVDLGGLHSPLTAPDDVASPETTSYNSDEGTDFETPAPAEDVTPDPEPAHSSSSSSDDSSSSSSDNSGGGSDSDDD